MNIPGPIPLTPRGEGGVSVLLLSREKALGWLGSFGVTKVPGAGEILFVRLHLFQEKASKGSEAVVEALLVGTPDGEGVEVHLPGNPALLRDIVEGDRGWAEPLFATNSPLEEECLRVAQRSPTSRGAALALSQISEGAWVSQIQSADPSGFEDPAFLEALEEASKEGERLAGLFQPTRIVLRGPTNAGKSTLFNLLLGVERVRTGPQAGLTLDPVMESVEGLGWPFVLVDTAGERKADGGVEQEAMELGRCLMSGSVQIEVRSLSDSDGVAWIGERGPNLRFFTHADDPRGDANLQSEVLPPRDGGGLCFDLKLADPDRVRTVFFQKVLEELGREPFPVIEGLPCLLTSRQRNLVKLILGAETAEVRRSFLAELKDGLS